MGGLRLLFFVLIWEDIFKHHFPLSFGNATTVVTHQTSGFVQEVNNFTLECHYLKFSFLISTVVLEIHPLQKWKYCCCANNCA